MAIAWGLAGFMFSPVKAVHCIPVGVVCALVNSFTGILFALGETEIAEELEADMAIFYGVVILGTLAVYMCLSTRKSVAVIAFIPVFLTVAISFAADYYMSIYEALPVILRCHDYKYLLRYCVGNTKCMEAIRTRKTPKSLRQTLPNITNKSPTALQGPSTNTKKWPSAPFKRRVHGGRSPPRGVMCQVA